MSDVTLRRMTPGEYEAWQEDIARGYAAEMVEAGLWQAEGSEERVRAENADDLPQGLDTPGNLLVTGLGADGTAIGRAWVVLEHPQSVPGTAYIYDIEVWAAQRGQGLGRRLLAAVERAAADAGATAIELSVFGRNPVAMRMYATAGYGVIRQQMRKPLKSDAQEGLLG